VVHQKHARSHAVTFTAGHLAHRVAVGQLRLSEKLPLSVVSYFSHSHVLLLLVHVIGRLRMDLCWLCARRAQTPARINVACVRDLIGIPAFTVYLERACVCARLSGVAGATPAHSGCGAACPRDARQRVSFMLTTCVCVSVHFALGAHVMRVYASYICLPCTCVESVLRLRRARVVLGAALDDARGGGRRSL
jgi:hypothetical protein